MKKFLFASLVLVLLPVATFAGPKEDAFLVVEQFQKAFDASDVQAVHQMLSFSVR